MRSRIESIKIISLICLQLCIDIRDLSLALVSLLVFKSAFCFHPLSSGQPKVGAEVTLLACLQQHAIMYIGGFGEHAGQ